MREALSDQLKPLADKLRRSTPTARIVSQVTLRVAAGKDHARNFNEARRQCLIWMGNRAGRRIPSDAWDGASFELEEVGAQRTAAVSLPEIGFWAGRIDDADKNVAQRYWSTELAVGSLEDEEIIFGCRLQCVTMGKDEPYSRSVPGIVQQIAQNVPSSLDGRQISLEPWLISNEDEVEDLVSLMESRRRRHNIIVLSLPEDAQDISAAAVSPLELCRRTIGAAHVAVITGSASFLLTDRVGKAFSVFGQAVRTYLPNLNFEEGQPFEHPLALPDRIRNWGDVGGSSFLDFIIDRAIANSVARSDLDRELPSFQAVRRTRAELERERAKADGSRDSEVLKLAEAEIFQLKEQSEEQRKTYEALLSQADIEITWLNKKIEQLSSERMSLRSRIEFLDHGMKTAREKEVEIGIPDDLSELEAWSGQHLAGQVTLHNRAIRAATKSKFENVELVYRALLVLRDFYVPMKREGGQERREKYLKALAELGLEEAPTFYGSGAGEQGEAYYVEFNGDRRELQLHLKGSNSRDPRYGFRLYFFWDDPSEQAVVGWLPSHLPTRLT